MKGRRARSGTLEMAPSVTCFALRRSQMTVPFLHALLFVICCLVVVSRGEAAMSDGSSSAVRIGLGGIRRELAVNATAMNATQSLLEDAEVLLLLKASLVRDPFNVTRYWKPIGKRQVINPCRPWDGITCTRRRVTAINLYNQSLEGTLITALGRLSNLRTLNLSSNLFSGTIPSELTSANSSLETLDLGSNNLTGALPPSLGDLSNLISLVVSDNEFTGAIPTSIGNLQSLRNLNLSGNGFSGTFPAELAKVLALQVLDLSNNNVSGRLPREIGSLTNLTVLDARNNMLTGELPATLGACNSLVILDVSGNPLFGSIPSTLGQLKQLEVLNLAGSNLTGTIPQELTGCTGLKEIDLSENNLHGVIPLNQSLSNLTVLYLQNNILNGTIPDGLGDLSLVKWIDLSSNKFSGGFPQGISKCLNLVKLSVASNELTGKFSVLVGAFPALTNLNVSHNFLNQSLPTLSHLANLKVFDASFNSFSGEVPSTFVNFVSLQTLNVSSNRLSGEVPFFTSHDNVTAESFLNNTQLCGTVLNIRCGSGKLATTTIVYIALGSAAGLLALLSVFFFCIKCCKAGWSRNASKHSAQVSAELQLKLTPEEILTATNRFNEANYIGVGKMSTVYRGVLPDETIVAVKRLAITAPEGKEDAEKALDAELEILGHIRHRSLVKVLGYCSRPEIKALVLEYMPHGSLDSLLYPPHDKEVARAFDWAVRFRIAVEVAEGLRHLHTESRNSVVHGDVKPSNILFDASMEARVGDYGVARILTEQGFSSASSTSTPGLTTAHGYTPPEVAASGIPSMKGDVYSFGIIMLEMISGRSPYTLEPGQTLPQWIRATVSNSKALQNVLDPLLMPELASHQQKMAMVLGVALLCTRNEPQERPQMDDVYKMLSHIKSKPAEASSRRKGLTRSERRNSSAASRARSSSRDQPSIQPLPHTPSLSDWTPPSQV